ncbi:BREX-1 system adenine-specific DNA-methyltransferase PglX [Shewanella xiamenensis]|uniref:BREX-1 system adenine-specific DNA-methyltransferase PglX n=1 Tax=Shewanella xiamenensis TaxID=332186 RepID=UPI0035B855E6
MSQQQNNDLQQHFYRASASDFGKIPGSPVAYWPSQRLRNSFSNHKSLSQQAKPRQGLATTDNDRFLRFWHECGEKNISFPYSERSNVKWYPCQKGGSFRKWFGNNEYVVNWHNNGEEIKSIVIERYGSASKRVVNEHLYFSEGITWSSLSSSALSMRYVTPGFIFETKGSMCFFEEKTRLYQTLGFCNSSIVNPLLQCISPTLDFHEGPVGTLPIIEKINGRTVEVVCNAIAIAKLDWDSYETSWDFKGLSFIQSDNHQPTLNDGYQVLLESLNQNTLEMQRLEEENNRLFIEAYGLQDELTPEVPLSEITLTCNPHYRYGGNLTDEEREARLQSDTIAELISYAIGCMMGRYSLDREGLVYAHAGNEGFKALVEEGAYATFAADDDGILPLTQENWFEDDVAARIEQFVATAWGSEHLEENLNFIADSLCLYAIKPVKKGSETARETIRRYLSTQFYKDHLKTYKKRPIYWLFSSGKEKAFECLVYLHRYNESTLPRMRTEYVTPLLGQIASRIERKRLEQTEASTAEAKRIAKDIDSLNKQLSELRAFDDALKHHADMRISLDLDDGVKVNYGKFGNLLSDVKAITGGKDE